MPQEEFSPTAIREFDLSSNQVIANPSVEELIEECIKVDGDKLASNGAITAYTGKYTGRTPKDKHLVRTASTDQDVWWGNNNPMEPAVFEALRQKAQEGLKGKKLYQIDSFAGADPECRIKVRFILERAYHALFIKQLLLRPTADQLKDFKPDWVVTDLCRIKTDPEQDHVKGDAAISLNFDTREVLIFGTEYAGEIKKSIFSVMNYLLPKRGILSMHCSSNLGKQGDTALFFGLSGTGKTTLSADPNRSLIGDDEHGWTDRGVFNIEGGCYAKCIHLSREGEPEIWDAIRHGAVLENVALGPDGVPDYEDGSLTENTRCAYPLEHIEAREDPSLGGHPQNIFFLTCDALGVLPAISKLTPDEAMEQFLIGYTAKVAGTEVGVTEPQPSFSTCFGHPFLPLPPQVYAKLLKEKIHRHGSQVWLVNTGWTGGPFGVGSRIKLKYTRAMLDAALSGELANVETRKHDVFGFQIPVSCPNVPSEVLNPADTWDPSLNYQEKAEKLKGLMADQLKKIGGI